jgi:hypothetical protein
MGRHAEAPKIECGPTHPEAFLNLAVKTRPPYAEALCPKCRGHGAWNAVLNNAGTFRNLVQACDRCRGDGWVDTDGDDYVDDIIMIDGHPAWVRVPVEKPANDG